MTDFELSIIARHEKLIMENFMHLFTKYVTTVIKIMEMKQYRDEKFILDS